MENMTANEYLTQYTTYTAELIRLEVSIQKKLIDMCKKYPDAPIANIDNIIIKAGGIGNKSYISTLSFTKCVALLKEIEIHAQGKLPIQLTIPF